MDTKIVQDLYCFALSFHFAKKHFKNTELVTDQLGASLLDFMGYKNVTTDLEEISHIDPRFWTAGKVKALRSQTGDCLHIDGDVFFVDPSIVKTVKSNWDVLVQMREVGNHFNSTYPPIFEDLQRDHPHIDWLAFYNFAYNTGIIGFKDNKFREEYCYAYFDLLYELELGGVEFPKDRDPNIAVEQSLLTYMSHHQNKYVKELISLDDMAKWDLFGAAERIGYVHLWGNSKYQDYWQDKVKARLKAENPALFNKLEENIKKFL